MENASKALIIAGAILVSIALISVGMFVMTRTSDVTDQVGDLTTQQAAQTFNANFERYTGAQKGSSVKQLLSSIASNNQTNGAQHKISVKTPNIATATEDATNIMADLSNYTNSTTYTVKITKMTNGYISEITIST